MVVSKFAYWGGRREERAEVMRIGRVAVSVVLFALQALMKLDAVDAGTVRERKRECEGREMGAPDQMLGGACVGGHGVERGRSVSRQGISFVLGDKIVVPGSGLGLEERAARKCL